MTAAALLHECQAAGLDLILEPPNTLVVRGPADARARLLPAIRQAKPALLAMLAATRDAVTERDTGAACHARDTGTERDMSRRVPGRGSPQAQALTQLAERYYSHHWSCPACREGTQTGAKLHRPCPAGAALWAGYCAAAGREVAK